MKLPTDLYYTPEHMWARPIDNARWQAGITDYAQDMLGDVVFLEPPSPDTVLKGNQPCGLVESVKTGSDLHAPMDGKVTLVNTDLLSAPESINDKPYAAWIFEFTPENPQDLTGLLSADDYQKLIG